MDFRYLIASFSAGEELQFFKPKSNKFTIQTTDDHFAKNKLSISEPNFTKSERKIRFEKLLVVKIEFTPLSDCNILPFLERVLKKYEVS